MDEKERKEPSAQTDDSMSGRHLYCLGIHFKCFYEQGINNKPFNPAEPCHKCKYGLAGERDCNLSVVWSDMKIELEKTTGIQVNHCVDK